MVIRGHRNELYKALVRLIRSEQELDAVTVGGVDGVPDADAGVGPASVARPGAISWTKKCGTLLSTGPAT